MRNIHTNRIEYQEANMKLLRNPGGHSMDIFQVIKKAISKTDVLVKVSSLGNVRQEHAQNTEKRIRN